VKLPKLNEPLIKETLAHIKRFPGSYDQSDVATACDVTRETPCGAIGCFGGWMVLLGAAKTKRHDLAPKVTLDKAQRLGGFTSQEADYLFDVAGDDPKENYAIIVERLRNIREARLLIEAIIPLAAKVSATLGNEVVTNDVTLDYSDYLP
jgi:hypothetical protein